MTPWVPFGPTLNEVESQRSATNLASATLIEMAPPQPRHKDKGSAIDAILNHLFGSANTRYSEVGVAVNTEYATESKVTEVTSSEREGESKPHSLCSMLNSQLEPVGYLRYVDSDTCFNRRHEVGAKSVFEVLQLVRNQCRTRNCWILGPRTVPSCLLFKNVDLMICLMDLTSRARETPGRKPRQVHGESISAKHLASKKGHQRILPHRALRALMNCSRN